MTQLKMVCVLLKICIKYLTHQQFKQGGLISNTATCFIIEVFRFFRVHQIIEESFLCLVHLAMSS